MLLIIFEMTELPELYDNMKNLHVSAIDQGDNIVFTHLIEEGATSKSYGIHVAELAGLNSEILFNAKEKLRKLENKDGNIKISNFIENDIVNLDVYNMTPMQVMEWVVNKQKELKNK